MSLLVNEVRGRRRVIGVPLDVVALCHRVGVCSLDGEHDVDRQLGWIDPERQTDWFNHRSIERTELEQANNNASSNTGTDGLLDRIDGFTGAHLTVFTVTVFGRPGSALPPAWTSSAEVSTYHATALAIAVL